MTTPSCHRTLARSTLALVRSCLANPRPISFFNFRESRAIPETLRSFCFQSLEAELQSLRDSHQVELVALQDAHSQRLAQLKRRHREEVATLKETAEVDDVNADKIAQLERLVEKLKVDNDNLQTRLNSDK